MNNKVILVFIAMSVFLTAFALASNKPDDHNQAWGQLHGQKARVSDRQCLDCHVERLECIACHEDVRPRSHNTTWSLKTHGQESRRSRNSCTMCHTEDSCIDCHQTSVPMSHRVPNYRDVHCNSCMIGVRTWSRTVNRDCIVCHKGPPSVGSHRP
jgi:hypothetical protein